MTNPKSNGSGGRRRLPLFDAAGAPQAGRRRFLLGGGAGLGALALESLIRRGGGSGAARAEGAALDFPAKAKRAIWLFMAGGPSHLDLLDYKPDLASKFDTDLPESVRGTQRLSTMTAGMERYPVAPSLFKATIVRRSRSSASACSASARARAACRQRRDPLPHCRSGWRLFGRRPRSHCG